MSGEGSGNAPAGPMDVRWWRRWSDNAPTVVSVHLWLRADVVVLGIGVGKGQLPLRIGKDNFFVITDNLLQKKICWSNFFEPTPPIPRFYWERGAVEDALRFHITSSFHAASSSVLPSRLSRGVLFVSISLLRKVLHNITPIKDVGLPVS